MPQMCKFVYDFYANKVAAMVEMAKPPPVLPNPDEVIVQSEQQPRKGAIHPGGDDSEDEDGVVVDKNEKMIVNEVLDGTG